MTILQPGQMLGPYQIINQIGKGGMATVYKAYQAAMDRYVALKVVAVQLSDDPNFMQRFRQEARLIARLEHPNILPVYDFGEADGVPYMVMRLIDSGTLQEQLASRSLTLQQVDHTFSQLASALEYAHENGVVHRDIKPSNAMVDKRGDVFLTDFGVAKMLEGSSLLSVTGAITGTPSYMSPEQAQGLSVDQRSDIYSLAVVLFEMLTGRVPFEAETPMAVLFKQIQDPPPPLSSVRPDLPFTLEAVLLKALSKKPADRYPTMGAFRDGWKRALAEVSHQPPAFEPSLENKSVSSLPSSALSNEKFAPPVQPSQDAVALKPVPAGPRVFSRTVLLGLGLFLCIALAAFLSYLGIQAFRSQQANQQNIALTAPGKTPIGSASGETPAASDATPAAASAPLMRSWAGANTVYAIAFNAGKVLAAGDGGITVWNPTDGSYKMITTADGLPGGVVLALFVDRDGSYWAGTDTGMVHINGNEHTTYTSEQGLDSDNVTTFARGGDRFFAGTQYSSNAGSGLLELNGNLWMPVAGFPSSDSPASDQVGCNIRHLLFDGQGNLWVATQHGLAMLDADNEWHVFTTETGLPDDNVYTVYAGQNNEIIAGTSAGGVAKYNWDKLVFESFADLNDQGISEVYGIQMDGNGDFWFAGDNVARYDPLKDEWTAYSKGQGSFPAASVISMSMDDQGTLYFGTYGDGLVRYAAGKFDTHLAANMPRFAEYGRIIPAPTGKLVFSHLYNVDADEFDPARDIWNALPGEQGSPLAFDAQGQLWSGGSDGVWIFGPAKTTHLTTDHGLPSNQVNALAFGPDGLAYIATDAGIALFDGLNVTQVITAEKDGLASNNVTTLFIASDGSLWAGVQGGFSRRLPAGTWQHFTSQKLFNGSAENFPKIVEDPQKNIWIASGNDGVYRFSNGEWKRLLSTDPGIGLPSNDISTIAVAPDGALWFGSAGQGVVRFDGKSWQPYQVADGLIDQRVNDIYVDQQGTAWIATSGGITSIQP